MRREWALLLVLLGPAREYAQTPSGAAAAGQEAPSPAAPYPAAHEAAAHEPAGHGPLAPDRVAGRVLSATDKHPIAGAAVTLHAESDRSTNVSTRTNAEGRYSFDLQPAGKYNLQASAPGYLGASYLQHEGFSTAIVLGAGLKTNDLTLELTPSAIITGRIVDEAGDPVQRATLTLFREDLGAASRAAPPDASSSGPRIARSRTTQTDDDGSFEFAAVAPGQFYLSATATPWYAVHARTDVGSYVPFRMAVDPALDVAYPELFYPGARSPEEATPFVVKAGEHLTANMVLRAEHAVTLSFRLPPVPPGEAPRYRFPQLLRSVFGIEKPVFGQNSINDAQTLTVTGLAPGHYTLRQFAPTGGAGVDAGTVDIGSEPLTMDLPSETASAGAHLQVTLHAADGAALPAGLHVFLRSTENTRRSVEGSSTAEGVFAFAALPAGDYRFLASRDSRNLPVLAAAQGGQALPRKQLHVSGQAPVNVDLTLSLYAPAIEGVAQAAGHGVAGCLVVLVPAGADTSDDLFRRDQSNLDGSFVLRNVVPGNYLLVAIEDGWPLRWNDPGALLPYLLHALPVTVPGSGAAAIHLVEPAAVQPR